MLFKTSRRINSSVNIGHLLIKRSFSVRRTATIDLAAKDEELRVFIVVGEVSGDNIGSRLMASLKKLSPFPVHFAGIGGSIMSKQGLKSLFPMEDIAVMGLWELLPHLNKFRVKLKETTEAALSFQPHAVITVDSKGFSFRFLKQLRASYVQQRSAGPPHFHYVAPSYWAWKGGEERLKGLNEFVDHIFCILPFEAEVCQSNGLDATFVGHPILEDMLELNMGKKCIGSESTISGNSEEFCSQYDIPSGSTVVSLLPGSRLQEVTRMLPIFLNTSKLLRGYYSDLTIVVHVAPNKHVEDYISKKVRNASLHVLTVPGGSPHLKYNALSASRVALCTSGTVAVEMQLARLPCVVAYRAHFLTELFIRFKAKIHYISLPNILLDSPVIPEALFQACNPSNLAPLLKGVIENKALREEQISAADKVIELLSPSDKTLCYQAKSQSTHILPNYTPSMIAAFHILYSVRSH